MTVQVSIEILVHFQCLSCEAWWSVGDYDSEVPLFCPGCGIKHSKYELLNTVKFDSEDLKNAGS